MSQNPKKNRQQEEKQKRQMNMKEADAICEDPYILDLIHKMADTVVQRAVRLPLREWLLEAQAGGFEGLVWFGFSGVHGDDVAKSLTDSAAVKALIPEGHSFALGGTCVLVYRDAPSGAVPERIVPLMRAMITPFLAAEEM